MQALIAHGEESEACSRIKELLEIPRKDLSPSALMTLHRVEAQVYLADWQLDKASLALEESRKKLKEFSKDRASDESTASVSDASANSMVVESAAFNFALEGAVAWLRGEQLMAESRYRHALEMPINLHNHLGFAWASVGMAVLLAKSGEQDASAKAIVAGIREAGSASQVARSVMEFLLYRLQLGSRLDSDAADRLLVRFVTGANIRRCEEVYEYV